MRGKSGFTIVELMIVIAIMGVLTAIAIPTYITWLPKHRANAAARQLFADLQNARMRAISENNDYKVEFITGSNLYKVYDDAVLVKTINIGNHSGIGFGYSSATNWNGDGISGSVTFTGTPASVTFQPTGRANKNGSIYFKPTEDATRTDRQRAVTVLLTGRIRMYKNNGTGWD
jgi:prepilin-type N-terminal cleavage/methylation domain-containing protein